MDNDPFAAAFGPLQPQFKAAYAAAADAEEDSVEEEEGNEDEATASAVLAVDGAAEADDDDVDVADDDVNDNVEAPADHLTPFEPTAVDQEEFNFWWTHANIATPPAGEGGADEQAITLGQVLDGVVCGSTLGTYIGDILHFLGWLVTNYVELVTIYGVQRLQMIQHVQGNERHRTRSVRIRLQLKTLLRAADVKPLVNLCDLTPVLYMEYVMQLRHRHTGDYLGKSAYGNKRSALYHLFRLHNKSGFPDNFKLELNNLFRGFFRMLQQQRPAALAAPNNPNDHANPVLLVRRHIEGKDPMSVALYELLARRFVGWGTIDGVFAFAFLVITFNLSCRSQNTGNICLSDISWSSSFDSFAVYFAHTKTDQTGEDAKYPRNLFANPGRPYCCPVFALALYFSCCVSMPQEANDKLFPGVNQHTRFSNILTRCLAEYSEDVQELGFRPCDIGTHSIRKGAVSHLSSMIGGPPAASICIRAGWTMGKVRDIYMRYITCGDTFCGRCLSLLPILSTAFAASPPHFASLEWEEYGKRAALEQFLMMGRLEHFSNLNAMCMASLFHHRVLLLTFMPNHVARLSVAFLRDAHTLALLDSNTVTVVTYPWNDQVHAFTGIPPHVAMMQQLTGVERLQKALIEEFIPKVKQAIDESGLTGIGVTEERLRTMFQALAVQLETRMDAFVQGQGATRGPATERIETGRGYTLHYYGGQFHRVPGDWRFPRVGLLDIWRLWWIGDTVRMVPPMKHLQTIDLKHLDLVPLDETERHGRTGGTKDSRRPAKKTLSDLSYLMRYMTTKLEELNAVPEQITMTSVDTMYNVLEHEFAGGRNSQKKWNTFVKEVRRRNKN